MAAGHSDNGGGAKTKATHVNFDVRLLRQAVKKLQRFRNVAARGVDKDSHAPRAAYFCQVGSSLKTKGHFSQNLDVGKVSIGESSAVRYFAQNWRLCRAPCSAISNAAASSPAIPQNSLPTPKRSGP